MKFLEDAIQNATSDRGDTWSCFIFFVCVSVLFIYTYSEGGEDGKLCVSHADR